jgi:hypothetical protein
VFQKSASYQGTTSVVPKRAGRRRRGFNPCGTATKTRRPFLKHALAIASSLSRRITTYALQGEARIASQQRRAVDQRTESREQIGDSNAATRISISSAGARGHQPLGAGGCSSWPAGHQAPDMDGVYYAGPEVTAPRLIRTALVPYPESISENRLRGRSSNGRRCSTTSAQDTM